MPIDLYYSKGSCPCQAIMLAARALGLELNLIEIHLSKMDHLKPEYLKMNPQHTIPTMNDNGYVLWESRAILGYLVDEYGKDDTLYPKDPKKRAVVNQRLYFDIGTLYPKYINYYYPVFYKGANADPAHIAAFQEPLELLEKFLEGERWVAGNDLTIADIALLTTVTIMKDVGYDVSKHPNVSRWLKMAKETLEGYEEIITEGNSIIIKIFKLVAERANK
ncbi:glutathione S-transferase 1-1-like [Periplaneta americana]|uniref:glutathione S-transferase 1-1-like n=1 Tax=Periplaneta americana TaxID=6978 RepID=UPI0037E8D673